MTRDQRWWMYVRKETLKRQNDKCACGASVTADAILRDGALLCPDCDVKSLVARELEETPPYYGGE